MPHTPNHIQQAVCTHYCFAAETPTPVSGCETDTFELPTRSESQGSDGSTLAGQATVAGAEPNGCPAGPACNAVKKWADMPTYTSTVNWDEPIPETDYLYRRQLSDLRQGKRAKATRLSIFDFDNTLFKSPHANPRLWDQKLKGVLQSTVLGWFHDARTLSAPYLQYTDDHWIRPIEELVKVEAARDDTLVVLLTGRSHQAYRDVILELIGRRPHLQFDIVILKEIPSRFSTLATQAGFVEEEEHTPVPPTLDYKMGVVEDAFAAFPEIKEIAMWDDRINHCERMQLYLDALRQRHERVDKAEVYHVPPQSILMAEDNERELVDTLVHEHNDRVAAAAKKRVALGLGRPGDSDPVPVGSLELKQYASYTGVFLGRSSRSLLWRHVRCPKNWSSAAGHMVLALGPADSERLNTSVGAALGDSVELIVDSIGTIANAVVAVRVTQIRTKTRLLEASALSPESLYITVAYNEPAGFRSSYAENIKRWRPLRSGNLVLRGVIGEHFLTTASVVTPEVVKDEVSIGGLVCQRWPKLKGHDIGLAVASVRQKMADLEIENSEQNRGKIADIVTQLF
ncbi:hypothetical protein LPJ60_006323 [Coemansia sp. RSA 2675]|uniref:Uncharacterized protein n=1 Tax=Coemansia linderi TaxID=2663919 RepID=A0ACC1KBE3_9FUNG|nr:hypothetical protein LPJ60_006323 [Coemansia sp. RSA 2675]KAJ2781345.1 hypothetical protein GGI18_003726 [Coemansia linderi]